MPLGWPSTRRAPQSMLPKFLDKEDVDSIFQKLHDALRDEIVHNRYQDTVDHNVEEWVAKAILVRGLAGAPYPTSSRSMRDMRQNGADA